MSTTVAADVAEVLFRPFTLGRLKLRNRIAMAPMTREMAPNGVPTAEMAQYYRRRAVGGVGMVITEGTAPNQSGAFGIQVPRFTARMRCAGGITSARPCRTLAPPSWRSSGMSAATTRR